MPEDPNQGNNPTDDGRPEWLPEKFKSPEDLARSYQEAENKIREQGAQLNAINENFSTLSEQLEELQAQQQAAQQTPVQQTPWAEMYENDPIGTQALLTSQIVQAELQKFQQTFQQQNAPAHDAQSELIASVAENAVRSKFSDYDELADQIKEEVGNNQFLSQDQFWSNPSSAAQAIEQAYTIVKARALLSGELQPEGQQYDARAAKLAAQTISGAQGGRPDPVEADKAAWDRIRSAGASDYASLHSPRT